MERDDEERANTFPSFRLWTCGTFRAERLVEESGTYEIIRTAEWGGSSYPRLLLKALLCCPGRRARREALVEMLWPETDPEQATQYINTATTKLRKVLELRKGHASLLLTEEDYKHYLLQGQQSLWVDVDEALTLLKKAESMGRTSLEALPRLEQATQYFNQGTFLDGEEGLWVAGKRATLERVRYRCRLWLAEAYEQQGMPGQAEMVITTLVEEDPLDEDALCRLMELLHRQGMTHKALRLYEQSVQRFHEELGTELNPSTIVLANRLREQLRTQERISVSLITPHTKLLDERPPFSHAVTQDIMEIVRELEGATDLKSSSNLKRRAVIAHLLGIPPALFTSDKYVVDTLTDEMKLQEETLSSLYEDMLIMGWDSFRRSKSPEIINKIDEHVNKLTALAHHASTADARHWQSLLCRFSQLSTRIAQHRMNEPRALNMAKQAIMMAIDLDDAEAIASTFYGRGRVHMEYSNTATDNVQKRKHFDLAKADIDAALGHVERVHVPLAGNIYLLAAEIYALIAGNDMALRTQCERWQDNVAAFVDSDKIEDDGTFLKLNPTALHHERAKTLLRFGRIDDARRELNLAWETLQPNLFTWHMNMHLTQATLFLAEGNIEESANASLRAHTLAKTIHSHKGEVEVHYLLGQLQQLDAAHSSIRNLTMMTGVSHE